MQPVTLETLRRILAEWPSVNWPAEALEDLVAPSHGVITGFHQFLREVEQVRAVDLGVVGPAGAIDPAQRPE
jgi:hypothetical protein